MKHLSEIILSTVGLIPVLGLAAVFIYYLYHRQCYTYWSKKGLPSSTPRFPFGDLSLSSATGKQSVYARLQDLYNHFKAEGYKHAGIYFFNGPIYFPIDPDVIKQILVTDFDHFADRGMYGNAKEIPLSHHIFSMEGDEWKSIRAKMSPIFTAGKMKSIYSIVQQNCKDLVEVLEASALKQEYIDIKDILLRYTADVIGSTSFGIDCNGLKDPQAEFSQMVDRIANHSGWKLLRVALEEGLQNPGNIDKIAYYDKTVREFFTDLIKKTVEFRDKNHVARLDFLHMLMELRNITGITFQEIVSQSFLFFIAGFKTSGLTLCYCMHELAQNQKLQDKLRQEIRKNLGSDLRKYSYEDVLSLPLLDQVLKETMRKYPPLPMLNRVCMKSYQIPGTDVVIEKGTPVVISLLGLHRDPEYFPDPLKFDVNRFGNENKVVPFTFLPFGDGPRNCIGIRFGYLQTKLAVASLLNSFEFLPNPATPKNLPIDNSTTTILFNVAEEISTKVIAI